ncbi:hypothetical protein DEU56DRAFT_761352 [Suillus clintonianus]|uniref:uncharacterized protein n=1 Tax=Suillus clintonianus TaxID=1904413 RepID=UPI001B8755C2|nr:uncharacterized protein DEU56DRAFT_761352 [Suillus clintonianus]KAG2117615.1 hypothetical protein DEU56DRAFT_761352 [Suillus clintonianus]
MNHNAAANGGGGNRNGDGDGDQNHQIPQQFLQHAPRPRSVTFTMTRTNLELIYVTWAAARARVDQELYRPHLPFQPVPLPPYWSDEDRAMMVLWVARERRVFEMEMRELEYLLGLRDGCTYWTHLSGELVNTWGQRGARRIRDGGHSRSLAYIACQLIVNMVESLLAV